MKRPVLLLLPLLLLIPAAPSAAAVQQAPIESAPVQSAPGKPAEIHLAVVACGDRLEESLVMLQSAARSARGHLTFHIFADDELRPRFQERLAAWPAAARAKFTPVLYPISYPGVEDPEKWRALFKPCASQRLFFPDLITSTERLLYVDTDILFLRPLDELWSLFDRFTPAQLAALAPEGEVAALNWYQRFARHPYVQPLGVNSGVMLMDLGKMRDARWRERILAYRKQYTAIPWGDQDLINIFFAESPEKLYGFSCAWNFRPDHCMYGSNCKAAEENGVAVVHGNRQSFHGDKQPTFRAVYDAFAAHGLEADAGALAKTLESGLAAVAGQSACGKVSKLFTAALEDPAPRSAAEDLHALFLFTNVDRKPGLQAKFSLAIESLFRHLALPAGARLTLHFVADPGSKVYGETFLAAYRRPDVRFVFHDKDEWTAKVFPLVEDMQKHFSSGKGSYYNDSIFFLSLGMHRLLPPEIERIVKLDFDVRFEANLYLLFQEFDRFGPENLIGLGPELQPVYRHVLRQYRHDHPATRLGSPGPAGFPGFNAGVTMLDLGKLRRSEVYTRALAPQAVAALAETYRFKGHLGDQDFYTLLAFEHEELFYKLDCGWNRQLCTWWKDKGYEDVFDTYHQCPMPVKMYHGNCSTPIPPIQPIQLERADPASPFHETIEPAGDEAGFYRDVAAAQLAPWRLTGIRRADLDQARALPRPLVKYQIRGGRLYRDEKCYFPPRCAGIEHFLLEVAPELPDLEFLVNVQDHPATSSDRPLPVFSFSKIPAEHADILYPAWAFWEGGPAVQVIPSWRWDLNRLDLLAAGDAIPWEEKKPAVFFRGSRTNETRDPYVLHAKQHPDLWDVRYTLNQSQKQTDHVTKVLGIVPAEPVSPRDHCAWRYLLNFDGVAASFRLKNVLACGGLVFYVEPKWVEFFYSKLVPGEHYVPLSLDIAEAVRTVDALRADDARARRIARNGRDFIEKHLTIAHVRRYWRDLLADYAALQRFEPAPDPGLILIPAEPHAGLGLGGAASAADRALYPQLYEDRSRGLKERR